MYFNVFRVVFNGIFIVAHLSRMFAWNTPNDIKGDSDRAARHCKNEK